VCLLFGSIKPTMCLVGRRSHRCLRFRMPRLLYEPRPTWDANAEILQGPTQAHAMPGLGIGDGYNCDQGNGEQSETAFGIHGMTPDKRYGGWVIVVPQNS